jgi:hypothetical protein
MKNYVTFVGVHKGLFMPRKIPRKINKRFNHPRGMFLLVVAGVLILAAALVYASQSGSQGQASVKSDRA